MKKTASLVLTTVMLVTMLSAFAVSASADANGNTLVLDERESLTLTDDTEYQFLMLKNNSALTVSSKKTVMISDGGSMALTGGKIILEPGASLIGSDVILGDTASALVRMGKGAKIDISFYYERDAITFSGLLSSNEMECARYGNRIVAPCTHENIVQKNVCLDCGHIYPDAISSAGSILSQGRLEIVYGVGGLAVGFVAAMLIFRKKKVAVCSTPAEDEE